MFAASTATVALSSTQVSISPSTCTGATPGTNITVVVTYPFQPMGDVQRRRVLRHHQQGGRPVRRLSELLRSGRLRRWTRLRTLNGERGGIAVTTALMVPLFLGAAGLAVDTAGVWAARQQALNGADAAALAVAMDCARNSCGDVRATAEAAFFANDEAAKLADLKDGTGVASVSGRHVRATSTWVVQHFFAAALGFPSAELSVESTAAWLPTSQATSGVALAISYCDYRSAIAVSPVNSGASTTRLGLRTLLSGLCSGAGPATTPGGTAWTVPTSGMGCATTSKAGDQLLTPAGNTRPAGCTTPVLAALAGKTLTIPVFDSVTGPTTSPTGYHVYGYAAFRVTSVDTSATPGLYGYFVWAPRQVDDTRPPSGAPDLGARSVFLIDPATY